MKAIDESIYQGLIYAGYFLAALSVFFLLGYFMRIQTMNSRSAKYKFVSERETKALRRSSNLIAFSIVFFSYAVICKGIGLTSVYTFYFVGFFSILIGFAIGYGFWAYIEYYYPFFLENKLNKIRFKPMKSPQSGRLMKLLNEKQEDIHLSDEMIEEEDALTVDYDVWMDELDDYKVIERYDTHYHALVCEECNFRTMKEKKEEIIQEPTMNEKGLLVKSYECSYCGHAINKEVKVPSLAEESQYTTVVAT